MKIKNTILITIVLLFSTFAHAGTYSLTVAVDGMACPFCAFGVEKRIKKVKGVKTVSVDMRTGKALVTAEPNASIHYRDVPQAVRDAGFTPGEMHITASGYIGKDKNNRMIFNLKESSLILATHNTELKTRLKSMTKTERPVVLTGKVFFNKAKEWLFTPETVEEAE